MIKQDKSKHIGEIIAGLTIAIALIATNAYWFIQMEGLREAEQNQRDDSIQQQNQINDTRACIDLGTPPPCEVK